MSFAIRKQPIDQFPRGKAKKNGSYLAFIRSLPCAVSGSRSDIEAAHLSFACTHLGHYGRAKSSKAPDRWALPLSAESHRQQHSGNEKLFWDRNGIDPHILALAIFGLWSDLGEDAAPYAEAIINQRLAAAGRLRDRSLA
jgi:hypothetical protein